MSWWDDLLASVPQTFGRIDAEARQALEQAFASGATTDAEKQAAFDKWLANAPANVREAVLADLAEKRGDLVEIMEADGYTGDLEKLTTEQLMELAGDRGLLALTGNARTPSASAVAEAGAAAIVEGGFDVDSATGNIEIYDRTGRLHEFIAAGQEGRPPETVSAEIVTGSRPGGPHVVKSDYKAAAAALVADPAAQADVLPNGDVVVTHPDGRTQVWTHSDVSQLFDDLDAAKGDPRSIGDAIDRAARTLGEGMVSGFKDVLGALPGGGAAGPASDPTGMHPGATSGRPSSGRTSTSTGTRPGDASGDASSTSRTSIPTSPDRAPFDPVWPEGDDAPPDNDPPNDDADPAPAAEAAPRAPRSGANSFMTEEEQKVAGEIAENNGGEDGTEGSNKTPPTDGTYADQDADGTPDDEDDDDDNDGVLDEDEGSEDEEEDAEEAEDGEGDGDSTDTGYTPAPDDDQSWRNLPPDRIAAMFAAAAARASARQGWSDRGASTPTHMDTSLMADAQARKLGMIGQGGSPDVVDGATSGTYNPPPPVPDDDTPGQVGGRDTGKEDPMLQHPQGTLDPSLATGATGASGSSSGSGSSGSGGSRDSGGATDPNALRPQEMVGAEVNVRREDSGGSGDAPALPDAWGYVAGNPAGAGGGGAASPGAESGASGGGIQLHETVTAQINVQRRDLTGISMPDPVGYVSGGSASDGDAGDPGAAGSSDAAAGLAAQVMVDADINVLDDPTAGGTHDGRSLSAFGDGLSLPDSIDLPSIDSDHGLPDR